jgi:hypothetical protein
VGRLHRGGPHRDRRSPSASGGAGCRAGATAEATRIRPVSGPRGREASSAPVHGCSSATAAGEQPARHQPCGRCTRPCRTHRRPGGRPGGDGEASRSPRCAPRGTLVRGRATLRSAERLDRSSGGPGPGDLTVAGSCVRASHAGSWIRAGHRPWAWPAPHRQGADTHRPTGQDPARCACLRVDGRRLVTVGDPWPGPRVTVSSRAGLSAGRRLRRRDAEMLLVVRRAERAPGLHDGVADDGVADVRNRARSTRVAREAPPATTVPGW